jgi:hypothetical protein
MRALFYFGPLDGAERDVECAPIEFTQFLLDSKGNPHRYIFAYIDETVIGDSYLVYHYEEPKNALPSRLP